MTLVPYPVISEVLRSKTSSSGIHNTQSERLPKWIPAMHAPHAKAWAGMTGRG